MKKATVCILVIVFITVSSYKTAAVATEQKLYNVKRLAGQMKIDADWNKPQWKGVPEIRLKNHMGSLPAFTPSVSAKMAYNDSSIFLIFKVQDRFVRCVTTAINGNVCEDAAVEFFFSPDESAPEKYFNFETNCGGTPLLYFNTVPRKEFTILDTASIKQIAIAHSLPKLIATEMPGPVTWTIEYKIPLNVLKRYAQVTAPKKGVVWRANFYKCADKTSNPHYLTWSQVDNDSPDFHLPDFFGVLRFN